MSNGEGFYSLKLEHDPVLEARDKIFEKYPSFDGLPWGIGLAIEKHKHVAHIFVKGRVEPMAHGFKLFGDLCLLFFFEDDTGARLLRVIILILESSSCVGGNLGHKGFRLFFDGARHKYSVDKTHLTL